MIINTTINILGGLPDWNLAIRLLGKNRGEVDESNNFQAYTAIKTTRSIERFESAINDTLIRFQQTWIKSLFAPPLLERRISPETRILLFWNASYNNDLFSYLNRLINAQNSA